MKINIINTTTDSEKTAKQIGKYLVKEQLSPCVQIIPKTVSIYKWKDKLEEIKEFLIIIKTIPENIDKCKELIIKLHNYDIPEFIVTEGEILLNTYSDWVIKNSSEGH